MLQMNIVLTTIIESFLSYYIGALLLGYLSFHDLNLYSFIHYHYFYLFRVSFIMSELSPMSKDVRFCNKIWGKTKTFALSTVKKKIVKATKQQTYHNIYNSQPSALSRFLFQIVFRYVDIDKVCRGRKKLLFFNRLIIIFFRFKYYSQYHFHHVNINLNTYPFTQ